MPLTPRYEWSQTDTCVHLQVNVPGFRKAGADVVVTPCCIKVNHSPYFLLLDLHGLVDSATSSVTVSAEGLSFALTKVVPEQWETLLSSDDKQVRENRRKQAFDAHYQQLETARCETLQRKKDEEKLATTRQWELEKSKRQAVEKAKQDELLAARTDLAKWQQRTDGQDSATEEEEDEVEDINRPMPDHEDYHGKGWRSDSAPSHQQLVEQAESCLEPCQSDSEGHKMEHAERQPGLPADTCSTRKNRPCDTQQVEVVAGEDSSRQYPCPRASKPVPVQFTKLETDHLPARQTREEEIRVYKKKIDRQDAADSVDMSERQPVFLKDKGDAMFRQGNFRGAINAYTRALDVDAQLPAVWANRAACHLKLGAYDACVADSTRVLQLLQPATDAGRPTLGMDEKATRAATVKALARRGAAYAESQRVELAVQDYTEAVAYDPDNSVLQGALQEMQLSLQPVNTVTVKGRGDARYKGGDYEGAVEAYTLLLQMPQAAPSESIAAYSNRSACHLLLGSYTAAVADCNDALQIILSLGAAEAAKRVSEAQGWREGSPPPVVREEELMGTELLALVAGLEHARRRSAIRVLSRRGTASTYLKRYPAALRDYTVAQQLLQALGESGKAAEMQEDILRVQQLQAAATAAPVMAQPAPAASRGEPANAA